MKVAYLFPEELPMRQARGVQTVRTVWALAEELEVIFLPAALGKEAFSFYGLPDKGPYVRVASRRWGPWKGQIFYLCRILPFLRRVDVLYTRHLKTALWLLRFRALHQRPVVYEVHEIFSEKAPKWQDKEDLVLKEAQGLVCVSQGLKKAIARRVSREACVIPNGALWRPVDLKEKFARSTNEFYYIGSLRYPWKGASCLLEALAFISPALRLVVIGEKKGDHPQVLWKGFCPPAHTASVLQKVQIAVLPNSAFNRQSREYTCPLKLLDYMAAGCAVVASDLPSVREIVSAKEVLFVPPDDPEALAQGVKTLWQDRHRRYLLGRAAHLKAKDYTWAKRARRLRRFLASLKEGL